MPNITGRWEEFDEMSAFYTPFAAVIVMLWMAATALIVSQGYNSFVYSQEHRNLIPSPSTRILSKAPGLEHRASCRSYAPSFYATAPLLASIPVLIVGFLEPSWRYIATFVILGPLALEVLGIVVVFSVITRFVWRESANFPKGTLGQLKHVRTSFEPSFNEIIALQIIKWLWFNALSWLGFLITLTLTAFLLNLRGDSTASDPPMDPFLILSFVLCEFGIGVSVLNLSMRRHSLPELCRSVLFADPLPVEEEIDSATIPPTPRLQARGQSGLASSVASSAEITPPQDRPTLTSSSWIADALGAADRWLLTLVQPPPDKLAAKTDVSREEKAATPEEDAET